MIISCYATCLSPGLRWSDAESSVVLQMSEADLLQKLCPQRESSPSFRRWDQERKCGGKM